MSPDLQRWLYEREKAEIVEVPGPSHVVYVSQPGMVAALIAEAARQ